MKKIAVMQPYLFPYLGYFQLAHAVDDFVFLDDVTFIKGGYINRNNILLNGEPHRFALPVHDISSFRTIHEHRYIGPATKFFDLLRHAYRKAPQFDAVYPLVQEVLGNAEDPVSQVNARSVRMTLDYLGVRRSFGFSSAIDPLPGQGGEERVVRLCEHRRAAVYINASGGRALYDAGRFRDQGLSLGFIEPRFTEYRQKAERFVPGLSVIDALMWNAPQDVAAMLANYSVDFPAPNGGIQHAH